MKIILLISSLFLSACAIDILDRPTLSSFKVLSPSTFVMSAYGRSKENAWAGSNITVHQRWVEDYLDKNDMCVSGFTFTNVTKTPTGRGRSHFLYEGQCNEFSAPPS